MRINCKEKNFTVKIRTARSFRDRFLGLMGQKSLPEGTGLLLENCSSIHMFFMRFPIRAVYLGRDGEVLDTEILHPFEIGKIVKGTRNVLEIGRSEGGDLSKGDRLVLENEKEVSD